MRVPLARSSALRGIRTCAWAATTVLYGCSSNKAPVGERLEPSAVLALTSLPSLPTALAAVVDTPDLKKVVPTEPTPAPTPAWAPEERPWVYPLPMDLGMRADDGGQGQFLAPRAHGKHNGVDFLAPVGTPLLAACDGKAKFSKRGGYGNVVHLVCALPSALGGKEGLYASLFYAHLDKVQVGDHWVEVKAGTKIGTVGKTGNASGPKVKPHLHLEIIVRGSEKEAIGEKHSGLVDKAKAAADKYFSMLDEACLEPAGFKAKSDAIRRERRTDPYVLLLCATKPKPVLEEPKSADLKAAQVKWSDAYSAKGFDVDQGPR
ncbi:MAG: M23 family metallopeptidase [Polyangiaceae bacterium]